MPRKTSSSSPSCGYARSAGRKSWAEAEARRRESAPEESQLAIFELFDEWFERDDFEGCSFINVLLEMGEFDHPVGRASAVRLENIRGIVRGCADEAVVRDPEAFARSWHILMKGSIVAAGEGDRDKAKRARELGRLLLAASRA